METENAELRSNFDVGSSSKVCSETADNILPKIFNDEIKRTGHVSLNFKVSTPDSAGRGLNGLDFYDNEKLKRELIYKADDFFNSGCAKLEQNVNASTIQQVSILPHTAHIELDCVDEAQFEENNEEACAKSEKGVSINVDGEFDVLLDHMEGLNTSKILPDMCGLKLCSTFDSSSKAIVVSSLETLAKILYLPEFDPHATPVKFVIKRALSLQELSHRKDNTIEISLPRESVEQLIKSTDFNPLNDCTNIIAKHEKDEFCTICYCKACLAYRDVVVHMMMEQFKASHMVVLFLDALLKAYSPLLRNSFASNHFESRLESNKDIYWLASGLIYNKKYEELDFIYDETLTDPMILVLFSSILMINSPMLLLQILAYYVKSVLEAFAYGIAEVSVDKREKLVYILDGFDQLCDISEQISSYFVIFERNFLSKFSLNWLSLCQRLFRNDVYGRFVVAIADTGDHLKDDDPLKHRYSKFVKRMVYLDMCWTVIWPKLHAYNLTEAEAERRKNMLAVHKLFSALVGDAIRLPIQEESDDNIFEDIHTIKDQRLLWQKILSLAKRKWPDGFFNEPNVFVYNYRCEKCSSICMDHKTQCKCITCSIASSPLLQTKNNLCEECSTSAEKGCCGNNEMSANNPSYDFRRMSNIENYSYDFKEMCTNERTMMKGNINQTEASDIYHISWAVFQHFTHRKVYIRDTIEEKYFCQNCELPACKLAHRLLNNDIAPELTKTLLAHFVPLPMVPNYLRGIFPVVFFINPQMFASHHNCSLHNTVVKAYWTFIISVFGTFFVDHEKQGPLNLSALKIEMFDIQIVPEKIEGNKDDNNFLEFLYTIRSYSHIHHDIVSMEPALKRDRQKKMDKLFRKFTSIPPSADEPIIVLSATKKTPSTIVDEVDLSKDAVTVQPTSTNSISTCDMQQKPSCTLKSKKCCLEHVTEFGAEHCKENHANRKRLKKDCGHARVNETRDRLRKKLQDVRKHQQQQQSHHQVPNQTQPTLTKQEQIKNLLQSKAKSLPEVAHQPSSLKSAAASAAAAISSPTDNANGKVKSSNDTVQSSCDMGACRKMSITPTSTPSTPQSGSETPQSLVNTDDSEQVIGKVMEICDMLDNNKQKMKKWLDETLTYIEGYTSSTSPTSASNKKSQPQTKDPKKAAKKAKQKLRRDEEKRISELYEVRAQFHDIYFKEFLQKLELKTLKTGGGSAANSKRRSDRKKISDVEMNIKKLQRAKAKLEANILELIATVKQTNTEFKFPYLPTKEQQQAKLQEISDSKRSQERINSTPIGQSTSAAPPTFSEASAMNSYSCVKPIPKFYPNVTFPYEATFPNGVAPPPPYGLVSHQTLVPLPGNPPFYSPPQPQPQSQPQPTTNQKPPNIMTALAGNDNSASTSSADPSKRIVTIRRVHNPNMPDSQVTVTARGRSQEEDKLLYTFINGQMMQVPITSHTEHPRSVSTQPSTTNTAASGACGATDETLPSKSQLKKERRRLAKVEKLPSTEPMDDESIQEIEQAEEVVRPKKQKTKEQKITVNKKELPPLKKLAPDFTEKAEEKVSTSVSQKKSSKEITKKAKKNSKLPQNDLQQSYMPEKSTEPVKKNTLKPLKKGKEAEESIASSDSREEKNVNKPKSKREVKSVLNKSETISKLNKSTEPTTKDTANKEAEQQNKTKAKEQKMQPRQKLVNHGQFDNNPYKALHMQDSDSELEISGSSCGESEAEYEAVVLKVESPKKVKQEENKQESESIKMESTKSTQVEVPAPEPTAVKTKSTQTRSSQTTETIVPGIDRGTKSRFQKSMPKHQTRQESSHAYPHYSKQMNEARYAEQQTQFNASNVRGNCSQRYNKKQEPSVNYSRNSVSPREIYSSKKVISNTNLLQSAATATASTSMESDMKSNSKRSQRSRKKQQIQPKPHFQHQSHLNYTDCGAGIPMRMEYFNPNDVNNSPSQTYPVPMGQQLQSQPQEYHFDSLTRQFRGMHVAPTAASPKLVPNYTNVSTSSAANCPNVSIMDQLNRGVQVENLSLPPGITLTKVDPIKSEQLRQKSESIKRLAQPLSTHNMSTSYPQPGTTIIAPPVSGYLPATGGNGNVIMVEGIKPNAPAPKSASMVAAAAAAAAANGKSSSKSKRRRNKEKQRQESFRVNVGTKSTHNGNNELQSNKMITLRNPMFHAGPSAAAASILQQPAVLPGRQGFCGNNGNLPMTASLPMDQPAAIIKNENGMFTIRNPALHQAVTNGLALSGYRQFGDNVSYYTPQEAVAEATKAQQEQQQRLQQQQQQQQPQHYQQQQPQTANTSNAESFSYFSNVGSKSVPSVAKTSDKTISISCTAVDQNTILNNEGERNAAPIVAPIARPSSAQRCISAIGSEVKQNRNSANMENLWSEYRQRDVLSQSHENLSNSPTSLLCNTSLDANNKKPTDYFNGYEVFPPKRSTNNNHMRATAPMSSLGCSNQSQLSCTTNSMFDTALGDGHRQHLSHHTCGDDSPPPTNLLGYSSTYLDDIPNTGVIRYDDASFLKNLIPGQQLNKEVSIHNINEANFGRAASPMSHLVEITPLYSNGNKVSPSSDLQLRSNPHYLQQSYSREHMPGYQSTFQEYDTNTYPSSSSNDNTIARSSGASIEHPHEQSYQNFGFDFETSACSSNLEGKQNSITDLDSLFSNNFTTPSQRSSPYLEKNIVQNLSSLQISCPEQRAQQQLNGETNKSTILIGNANNASSTKGTPAGGWW